MIVWRKEDYERSGNFGSIKEISSNAAGPLHERKKEDSEGLKADELREILLTVKGIGPAKTENIMEAVGKALEEKG